MGKAHWDPEAHPERAGPMLSRIPLVRRQRPSPLQIESFQGWESSERLVCFAQGHFAESIDVAKSVVFLLHEEHAAMVHGAMLPIDGGFLVG